MAYTNRWSITFKDYDGTTRVIYIQQDGWTGGVTALTPGNNPMIWEEDSSEDLTRRVRGKTGRIEVVEHTYGELRDLYPSTPLQNRVVCNGIFFGYIKAQNSSNAWEAGPRTLKLNILSPLALAYDIPMPINTTMGKREMGSVIVDLMDTLDYQFIVMPIGRSTAENKGDFFRGQIRGMLICPYANDKDYHYANNNEVFEPISTGELLEYICERHDLIARDSMSGNDAELLLTKVVMSGSYYNWARGTLRNQNYDTGTFINNGTTERELLANFTVADDNNTEQLVLPYSTIDVTHEGERGSSVEAPTKQSEYVEQQVAYHNLLARGIWLTNNHADVTLHGDNLKKPDTEGHNFDDWENADVLDAHPLNDTVIGANTLLFSLNFYDVDPSMAYQLRFKYSHEKESGHDSLYLSAKGKSGWFYLSQAAEDVRPGNEYPTYSTEQKRLISIGGGEAFEKTYEATIRCGLVPDEFITVNFYVGSQDLKRLKIYDVRLEATPAQSESLWNRYNEQRFVERYPPWSTGEKKLLKYIVHLNKTFFSNFYDTDLEYNTEVPYFLTSSQRRVRITVKGSALSRLWYMYRYYVESQDAPHWKLVAVSYNVRMNTYTLTLHSNNNF